MLRTPAESAWPSVSLSDLCEKTSTTNPSYRPDEFFKYVDVSCVSNEAFKIVGSNHIQGKDAPSRARQLIQHEDVIFATVRPALRRVAMVPHELHDQVCSTGFCVLRANKRRLFPEFLYFYLLSESVCQRVESLQSGATYPAINDGDLFRMAMPLPSLPEQRAIAQILQTVQEAKEARRCELILERERKAALMEHLFAHGVRGEATKQSEIGEIPESWSVVRLGTLAKFKSGRSRPTDLSDSPTTERSVPVYGGNGIMGFSAKHTSDRRLLVIGRVGAYCGCVHVADAPNWITDNALYATELQSDVYLPFLAEQLRLRNLNQLQRTGAQPLITQGILHQLEVVLPAPSEQRAIADLMGASDDKAAALEQELTLHSELFNALLEELMTGQVGVEGLIDRGSNE